MKLTEKDIRRFLLELGWWMSKRRMYADIAIGGGASFVLQTQFRRTASDIDMAWLSISHPATRDVQPIEMQHHQARQMLYKAFKSFMFIGQVDKKGYDSVFASSLSRRWGNDHLAPYGAILDTEGMGITINVVTLDYSRLKKRDVLKTARVAKKDRRDFKNLWKEEIRAIQGLFGIRKQYWFVNLGEVMPALPSAPRPETAEAIRLTA